MNGADSDNKVIRDIFCRLKDDSNRILIDAFNKMSTCNGIHLARTQAVQRRRRSAYLCKVILSVPILILVFATMWFLRSYNNANKFGGCLMNFLWPFEECPIVF